MLVVVVVVGLAAARGVASPKPHPAHSDLVACLRLVKSYTPDLNEDVATMRAGDALDWFLYESRTKSVRAIMGTRNEDDAHAPLGWGTKMGAWCKAHYPDNPAIQSATFAPAS